MSFPVSSITSPSVSDQASLTFRRLSREDGEFTHSLGPWNQTEIIERFRWTRLSCILGNEYADIVTAMGNLAKMLSDLGERDEAAEMQIEVLEKRIRMLGIKYINTISVIK